MNSLSKRHHYIPVFFIKGFIDPLDKLWVFDKEADNILPVQKSPKSIFFQWNKNNVEIDGHAVDFLETDIHKHLEDILADYISRAQQFDLEDVEQQDIILRIILLIGITFCRVPAMEEYVEDLTRDIIINKLPAERSGFIDNIKRLGLTQEDENKVLSSFSFFLNFFAS